MQGVYAKRVSKFTSHSERSSVEPLPSVALSAEKTQQGFYGLNLTGYQDTLLANEGAQIYARVCLPSSSPPHRELIAPALSHTFQVPLVSKEFNWTLDHSLAGCSNSFRLDFIFGQRGRVYITRAFLLPSSKPFILLSNQKLY